MISGDLVGAGERWVFRVKRAPHGAIVLVPEPATTSKRRSKRNRPHTFLEEWAVEFELPEWIDSADATELAALLNQYLRCVFWIAPEAPQVAPETIGEFRVCATNDAPPILHANLKAPILS